MMSQFITKISDNQPFFALDIRTNSSSSYEC